MVQKIETVNIHTLSGEVIDTVVTTHLLSETGHFEIQGQKLGWHIALGTFDDASNYTEVDDHESRELPDFPDQDIYIEEI